jgi:hypothetical protein
VRSCFGTLLLAGLAAVPALATAPAVLAADLTVTPGKRAVGVVHHRTRVVADYDGTPIVLRRLRAAAVAGPPGTVLVQRGEYDAYPVLGAIPRYYFNGRPVRN